VARSKSSGEGMVEYIGAMANAEIAAELQRWLVHQGYDGRNSMLLEALERVVTRLGRFPSEEERHRIVEAALMGHFPPDVRH
jgi:hypothetical protein